ncbi:MAG: type III-A CRISPR-associated RAMP protein Csm3 [bacterium]
MRLRAKFFIKGKIEAKTGLTIGGNDQQEMIGGIDQHVMKDAEGIPYIPGSSLKGKLRSLLELKEGKNLCECGECDICTIFGAPANKRKEEAGPTRFYVRDAALNEEIKNEMNEREGIFKELEMTYTESKTENTIDRKTSEASNPRTIERVPAGARFDFEMVFNILQAKDLERLNMVITALNMLEDDYLGGSGSRGYGRIQFIDLKLGFKTVKEYEANNQIKKLYQGSLENLKLQDLKEDFRARAGIDL